MSGQVLQIVPKCSGCTPLGEVTPSDLTAIAQRKGVRVQDIIDGLRMAPPGPHGEWARITLQAPTVQATHRDAHHA